MGYEAAASADFKSIPYDYMTLALKYFLISQLAPHDLTTPSPTTVYDRIRTVQRLVIASLSSPPFQMTLKTLDIIMDFTLLCFTLLCCNVCFNIVYTVHIASYVYDNNSLKFYKS